MRISWVIQNLHIAHHLNGKKVDNNSIHSMGSTCSLEVRPLVPPEAPRCSTSSPTVVVHRRRSRNDRTATQSRRRDGGGRSSVTIMRDAFPRTPTNRSASDAASRAIASATNNDSNLDTAAGHARQAAAYHHLQLKESDGPARENIAEVVGQAAPPPPYRPFRCKRPKQQPLQ